MSQLGGRANGITSTSGTLVVAMLLILLVSRSLTDPLTQLAAEDIAAGNNSRRVDIKGPDDARLGVQSNG